MNIKFKYWVNMMSYIAIIALAIIEALFHISFTANLLNNLLGASIATIVYNFVYYFAIICLAISAFYYASSRRNPAYMIFYVIAVIAVVIFKLLPYLA